MKNNRFVTPEEASKLTGKEARYIRKLRRLGKIDGSKDKSGVSIDILSLIEYEKKQELGHNRQKAKAKIEELNDEQKKVLEMMRNGKSARAKEIIARLEELDNEDSETETETE